MGPLANDKLGAWLERALDLSYRRHTTLSSNIANVDTPGYKAKDLDFRSQLAKELKRGPGLDKGPARPLEVTFRTSSSGPGLDNNTVDLDTEVMTMNANQLFYDLASETTSRRLSMLRYAIDEGGR